MVTTVYSDSLDNLIKKQSLLFSLGYLPNGKIHRVDNVFYRDFILKEKQNDVICCLFISLKRTLTFSAIKDFIIYEKFFRYPYRIYFKFNRSTKDIDVLDFIFDEVIYMDNIERITINDDFLKNSLTELIKEIRKKDQGYFNINKNKKFLNFNFKENINFHFHKFKT